MNRRTMLKTITGFISWLLFPRHLKGSPAPKPYSSISEWTTPLGNFVGIRADGIFLIPEPGEVYFLNCEIGDWYNDGALVYTNAGWTKATDVFGKEKECGISGHILRCYGHPELANTESGLAEARWRYLYG